MCLQRASCRQRSSTGPLLAPTAMFTGLEHDAAMSIPVRRREILLHTEALHDGLTAILCKMIACNGASQLNHSPKSAMVLINCRSHIRRRWDTSTHDADLSLDIMPSHDISPN